MSESCCSGGNQDCKDLPAGGDCYSAKSVSETTKPAGEEASPLDHFRRMIPNCLAYAKSAKAAGRPIVGIFCEYTPRELIMAAGAVPVCMCGGSETTIAAAETELPANLCSLIKSSYGYAVERSNPFLEMADLLVAETTCDGKKKMYELLARRKAMHVMELTQKPDTEAALRHWKQEIIDLKDDLEKRFNVVICDVKLRAAIRTMNRERSLRRRIAELMTADNPPLTGKDVLLLKSSISGICADLSQYERLLEMFSGKNSAGSPDCTTSKDAVTSCSETLTKSRGRVPHAAKVRVLMTGVPMPHGAERVMDIVESCGGLVVCQETCTGLKPILEDVDETASDPLDAIARKYLRIPCSCMTPNTRRLDVLGDLVAQYRPEVMIDVVWMACHTYAIETERVRRLCEEKWDLPYLRIETDYSPADSERIRARVETTMELAGQRRGGNGR